MPRGRAPQRRTLRGDWRRLRGRAEELIRRGESIVEEQVDESPLLAVTVAAGIGFALGGGLPRGTWSLVLGAGGRMAASRMAQEFLSGLDPHSATTGAVEDLE